MEERMAGSSNNKDKKYVLYTVVGEERQKTSTGSWMIRILLGSLMIVALAVVPYVSLRIAQANSRTLVVFQPVPVRNRSHGHHRNRPTSSVRSKTVNLMQVADLTLENYTTPVLSHSNETKNGSSISEEKSSFPITALNTTTLGNGSIVVTLHESDVTISVMEDRNDSKLFGNKLNAVNSSEKYESDTTTMLQSEIPTTESTEIDGTDSATIKSESKTTINLDSKLESTVPPFTSSSDSDQKDLSTAAKSTSSTKTRHATQSPDSKMVTTLPSSLKTTTESDDRKLTEDYVENSQKTLAHKLVYVATSASGNHVGGICVWKVDKNITDWSYFYDNIPIEFQSGHDTGDHEIRAALAAVRTWSDKWQDAHVTLRSQHNAIEHSDLAVRTVLAEDLEKLSDGHFTYELEWRLPEADTLVKISNSLSRLHQDYKFWYQDFKTHVDELLGKQDWEDVKVKDKHVKVQEESFFTDENTVIETDQPNKDTGRNTLSGRLTSTTKPKVKTPRPLAHKLVYVATSASGNHVGGFCMWKLDKNVTDWSYFYDNIPVEYQSNHDSADHEQRATLAAARVWAERWQDAHVTLRSQHAAIERSDSYLKKVLVKNLDKLSEGHFTYDLEWRLRKSDDLVKISFSLSRLHRNFAHWFDIFKASVDEIVGVQDWDSATKDKRVMLTDNHFYTKENHSGTKENILDSSVTIAESEK